MLLVLAIGGVACVWLMIHHRPGWYQPISLDEAGLKRTRADAATTADDISDRIVHGEPFDLVLHDRAVTEWLVTLVEHAPERARDLPPELSELAVRFDDGLVRIGVLLAKDGRRAILGAAVTAELSDDGRDITIALSGVRAGSLPLPRAGLVEVIGPILEEAKALDPEDVGSPVDSALRRLESIDELFDGIGVRNRFIWPNGERPFRIDSIEIEDGELKLRIEPL